MVHEAETWRRVAARAIAAGYGLVLSVTRSRLAVAGDCQNPIVLQRWGRPSPADPRGKYVNIPEDGTPYGVDIMVRCRHCTPCMRYRAATWAYRVTREAGVSSRCWFLTLTFSAEKHTQLASVEPRRFKNGMPRYAVRAAQNYLKRLRKACGKSGLRHMWVCELHKSGLPHLHMLLLEQSLGTTNKRMLERCWGYGFVKAKLIEEPAECAKYVVKYMSKADGMSIRASLHFGTVSNTNPNYCNQIPMDWRENNDPQKNPLFCGTEMEHCAGAFNVASVSNELSSEIQGCNASTRGRRQSRTRRSRF